MPGSKRSRPLLGSLLLTAALALAVTPPNVSAAALPSLGDATGAGAGDEYRLGRAWLREFRGHVNQWRDPITGDYIDSLVSRLVPESQLGEVKPLVTLVASRSLNAFAVPGGVIGINTGLFLYAPDQDAFASVIAHELGHLSQHHFAREMARSERSQLPTMAAMLAGMVIAAGSGGASLGMATVAGTQAATLQSRLSYSRRYEQEADRVGLRAMARSGFDPMAMPRMFATLQQLASMQGDTPPEFLLSHPVSQSRLSDTTSLAQQYAGGKVTASGPEYDMIRARVMLAMDMRDPQAVRSRLQQDDADPLALDYLSALTASVEDDHERALAAFDRLAERLPGSLIVSASAADAALDANRREEAIHRSDRILRLTPGYYPARMIRAEALLSVDPTRAFRELRELAGAYPEHPDVWNLLAEAAGRSDQNAWGYLALSERDQLEGDIEGALAKLDQAESEANRRDDQALTERIRDRREAYQTYQKTLERLR